MPHQVEMISLEELVPPTHIYRKFKELWDFTEIGKEMNKMESNSDHKGPVAKPILSLKPPTKFQISEYRSDFC